MSSKKSGYQDARDDLPFMVHSELDDLDLSPFAFRVYAHAIRRAHHHGIYWESVPNAAAHCRMSVSTYRKALRDLVERRLLIPEERPGQTTIYRAAPKRYWLPKSQKPDRATPTKSDRGSTPTKSDTPIKSNRGPLPEVTGGPLPKVTDKGNPYEGNPTEGNPNTPPEKPATPELTRSPKGDERINYDQFKETWNENRGNLPKILTLNNWRKNRIRQLHKQHEPQEVLEMFRAAVRAVATDNFWTTRQYGLDNLLTGNKILARAEQWQNTRGLTEGNRKLATTAARIARAIEGMNQND